MMFSKLFTKKDKISIFFERSVFVHVWVRQFHKRYSNKQNYSVLALELLTRKDVEELKRVLRGHPGKVAVVQRIDSKRRILASLFSSVHELFSKKARKKKFRIPLSDPF